MNKLIAPAARICDMDVHQEGLTVDLTGAGILAAKDI
jgi:hypothetical protein